ncbi:MAG TPA: hypothetical protein VJU77_02045 [Chthoniobacterales bacterium]|nr:hypothetical protein [Chthoniobacterales bacterium]
MSDSDTEQQAARTSASDGEPKPPTTFAPQASPWEAFIVGKGSADKFLKKMGEGAITIPNAEVLARVAEAIAQKPKRLPRLIGLLQASTTARETIRLIVIQCAEHTIRRLDLIPITDSLSRQEFAGAVDAWLARIVKRPLTAPQLTQFWLLINLGRARQLIDADTAFAWTKAAITPAKRKKSAGDDLLPDDMLGLLTSVPPSRPVLAPLVAQFKAARQMFEGLERDITTQSAEIDKLTREISELEARISSAEQQLVAAQRQKKKDDDRIEELGKTIVDLQDGYQHKLDALRARVRGALEGQLTRWLQTALDASRSDPPFMQAIEERLEESLKFVQREAEWLQRSA